MLYYSNGHSLDEDEYADWKAARAAARQRAKAARRRLATRLAARRDTV